MILPGFDRLAMSARARAAAGNRPLLCRRHERTDPRGTRGRGGAGRRRCPPGGADAGWAADTHAGLISKSPTGLKVTLRQLIVGRDCDVEQALALEYRLTQHFMAGHDFYEGVRAVLIDKDQHPRWRPASLAESGDAMVDAYFAPIGDRELNFDPGAGKSA
jgi:enoyl-CoA hydratase/carnithine racemase